MSELPANVGAPTRSAFVTVIAWLFIVMSGFATLIGIFQNIMVQAMYADPNFLPPGGVAADTEVPAIALFLVNYMRWVMLAVLLVFVATLAASIALLKRLEWGRWSFIAILALGIAWNLGGFGLMVWMFASFPASVPGQEELMAQFRTFQVVMLVVGGLWALGMSALLGWIIKKLLSPEIAREFLAGSAG